MILYLAYVAPDSLPALNLPLVFIWDSSAHIVTTIPLEPTPRVSRIYPTFLLPNRQRLAGINFKKVQARIVTMIANFRFLEPIRRILFNLALEIIPAKHA